MFTKYWTIFHKTGGTSVYNSCRCEVDTDQINEFLRKNKVTEKGWSKLQYGCNRPNFAFYKKKIKKNCGRPTRRFVEKPGVCGLCFGDLWSRRSSCCWLKQQSGFRTSLYTENMMTILSLPSSLYFIFIRDNAQLFAFNFRGNKKTVNQCLIYFMDKMCKYIQYKANKRSKDERYTIAKTQDKRANKRMLIKSSGLVWGGIKK